MKHLFATSCFALSLAAVGGCHGAPGSGEFDDNAAVAHRLVETLTTRLADQVAHDDVVTDSDVRILFEHTEMSLSGLENVQIRGLSIESVSRVDGSLKNEWKETRGNPDIKTLEEVFSKMPPNLVREGGSAIRAQITATYATGGREEDISEAIVILPRKVALVKRADR